jgi:hypothetical protein
MGDLDPRCSTDLCCQKLADAPCQPSWSPSPRSGFARASQISTSNSSKVLPCCSTWTLCLGLPTARSIQFAAQKARTVYGAFGSITMS